MSISLKLNIKKLTAVVDTWPTQAVSMSDMIGSSSIPPSEGRAMAAISFTI